MGLYTKAFLFFGIHSSYVGWTPSPLTPFQCIFEIDEKDKSGELRGTWDGGPTGGTIRGHYLDNEARSYPPLEEGCIEPTKLAQAKALFEELASDEFADSEES